MAKFTVNPRLQEEVAGMVRSKVDQLAQDVRRRAESLAPPLSEWRTMGDNLVRPEHRGVEGQKRPEGLRFEMKSDEWDQHHRGLGGTTYLLYPRDRSSRAFVAIVNCFLGDTLVSAEGVRASFRRWYDGSVVRIETQHGRVLSGTPNHPILTTRGWVALGRLDVGDEVIGTSIANLTPGAMSQWRDPYVCDSPSRIDEVARTLTSIGSRQWMLGRPMDFHGDGRDTEINTVRANRPLKIGEVPTFRQSTGEIYLPDADSLEEVVLAALGPSSRRRPRVQGLPSSLLGVHSKFDTSLWPLPHHTDPVSLGSVPRQNAPLAKEGDDAMSRDSIELRQGEDGLACEVSAADVVDWGVWNELERLSSRAETACLQRDTAFDKALPNDGITHAILSREREARFTSEISLDEDFGRELDSPQPIGLLLRTKSYSVPLELSPNRARRSPKLLCQPIGRLSHQIATRDVLDRELLPNGPGPLPTGVPIWANPQPVKHRIKCAGRHPGEPRDIGHRFPSEVSVDSIVSIVRQSYSGYVYNLETSSNWYVANGIIAHNCRCHTTPAGRFQFLIDGPNVSRGGVTATVYTNDDYAIDSEFGTSYPDGNRAAPKRFMARAVAEAAAASR